MNWKNEQSLYHSNVNVNLTEENVNKIKTEKISNADVCVKT